MPHQKKIKPTVYSSILAAATALLICFSQSGHAALEITPRLSSGVEYTDNFFLTNDNPGSEKESEWITSISPGLTVDLVGRRVGLSLSYDPAYIMYDKYSDRDYWEHAANATGTWQITRHTNMELSYDYLRTEDPIDEEDLTIRRGRNLYERHTSGARVDYHFGEENIVYADGNYSYLENEDTTIEDSQEYGGSAGVSYWFNIRWGLDFSVEQNRAEYEESDDFTDLVGRLRLSHRFNRQFTGYAQYAHTNHRLDDEIAETDHMIYDGAVGFEYAIDPSMDLTMEIHYFVRDFDGSEDESETPVNLSFTKRFTHGSIGLNVEGGYDYTAASAENLGYYVYYGGSLEADYMFTRRISGDVSIGYTYNDYKDEIPRRDDDVYHAGCGLSFSLLRWLTARLDYTYRSVESNIEENDYIENRGALLLTIAPPQPYRF